MLTRNDLGIPDNIEIDSDGSMWHSDCSDPLGPVEKWDEDMPETMTCGGCGAVWHYRNEHWTQEEIE